MWIALGVVLCGIVLTATPGRAATTQTTTTIADEDTYVYSSMPSTNYGYETYYLAGWSGSSDYIAYFHFPYTPIPANFQSAEIVLNYYTVNNVYFYADVYSITNDSWSEYSVTWNNQPYKYGGGNKIASSEYVSSSYTSLSVDVTSLIYDTNGLSIAVNSTHLTTGYMQGYSSQSTSLRPSLVYTYLVSSFIPGYDVTILAIASLGIVAILAYKYRRGRSE